MNPAFAHMAQDGGGGASRPARLIAGDRRRMHGHLSKAKQDSGGEAQPAASTTGRSFAEAPKRPSSRAKFAGVPPGMPWMAAHSPDVPPPPPPPPPEAHQEAYIDPVPASKTGGGLNSFHYQRPVRPPPPSHSHAVGYGWEPPANLDQKATSKREGSGDYLEPSVSRDRDAEHVPQGWRESFSQQQIHLQDEMMKMKFSNDQKREATAAKVHHAKEQQKQAASHRAKLMEEEAARRKAEASARIREMEEAINRAREAAKKAEQEDMERQRRESDARSRQRPSKPFEGSANPREAQQEDFRRRQAAAEARRRREAAANGAKYQQPRSGESSSTATQHGQPAKVAALFRKHEAAWVVFEKHVPASITMEMVPWPPQGHDALRGAVSAALMIPSGSNEDAEIRAQYKRLAMRWHPDKFLARYGAALREAEREVILERVKGVQQSVNQTYNLLK